MWRFFFISPGGREQYYIDNLKPIYNIAKIAGNTLGIKKTKSQRDNISRSIKGKYIGEKSALFGRNHTTDTKELMSLAKLGNKNPLFGKKHNNETKSLMRNKRLGISHSNSTKEKIALSNGQAVYLYKINSNLSFTDLSNAPQPKGEEFDSTNKYLNTQDPVFLKENYNDLVLIKKFSSIRELGKFFNVSPSTISRYLKLGKIFRNCYKISITPLLNE